MEVNIGLFCFLESHAGFTVATTILRSRYLSLCNINSSTWYTCSEFLSGTGKELITVGPDIRLNLPRSPVGLKEALPPTVLCQVPLTPVSCTRH